VSIEQGGRKLVKLKGKGDQRQKPSSRRKTKGERMGTADVHPLRVILA
jgi:hypothetical protein